MTDELIERFFKKECTAREAAEVAQYLNAHPEVLNKYLNAAEWFAAGSKSMPPEFWNDSWTEISARRNPAGNTGWLKRVAVAAAVVISAGLVYKNIDVKENPARPANLVKAGASVSERKVSVNNTTEVVRVVLADSSSVMLSPGSRIIYTVPFDPARRALTLEGEGRFKVMKNKNKPFTVFAGSLATTALGTEFTINTKNNISVKLHTGKVIIVATGEAARHWKKDVILHPGQQLNYNAQAMTAVVGPIKAKNALARSAFKNRDEIFSKEEPLLNFRNSSLPDVISKLTHYYHEKIVFDHAELDEMNFTGTLSRNDSLAIVLKVIAQMNNLELKHNADGYQLKKLKNQFQQ